MLPKMMKMEANTHIIDAVMAALGYIKKQTPEPPPKWEPAPKPPTKRQRDAQLRRDARKAVKIAKYRYEREFDAIRPHILRRDGHRCQKCGSESDLHVHHKTPKSVGGTNGPGNLVTLCRGCHAMEHVNDNGYSHFFK